MLMATGDLSFLDILQALGDGSDLRIAFSLVGSYPFFKGEEKSSLNFVQSE